MKGVKPVGEPISNGWTTRIAELERERDAARAEAEAWQQRHARVYAQLDRLEAEIAVKIPGFFVAKEPGGLVTIR